MASSFLSSILSKTSQVAGSVQRWAVSSSSLSDPRSSVLKDLKKLQRTLQRIRAVIHDAEEREIREEAVKLWVKELKEVAYDAEDVLDEYHYEELRAQVEGRASLKRKRVEGNDEEEVSASLSTIAVSIPDGMGDRIREIRERFDEILEDRERLRLREEDGERRVLEAPNYPPPTSHMVDESSIYGREQDKKEVIDLLLSEGMGNVISVVPIVGKGGLGKTTIAQLVYNDSEVKGYFDLTGWVCVSDDFDVTRLTKAIIESLTRTSCDLKHLSTLQDTLKERVQGKKVLLVLDDIWNEQQSRWESLTYPFVCAQTVRIIVTCRNELVAKIMQTDASPYHPDCLSPEQSWLLFKHYAFGFGGQDREGLADIGKQIVKKCSGLPLAVKTVGSLLRHEIDEDSWMEVLQNDLWELDKNDEILGSLRLSYSRMPAHLKPCFIYCSMFPKDYKFDKDDLVRLWMAQGYIPSQGRRRLEVIGAEYFHDLQRRSFFDPFSDGFKMHDMIHDLAKFIAGNECYAIVDKKQPDSPEKVRHLYVEEDANELVKSVNWCNFGALRTLLPQSQYYKCPWPILEITQFPLLPKYLRALEFSWKMKDEMPDLLGNLKHLRYLHIHSEFIKKLPESVCLLYHLQILRLYCKNLEELPSGISNQKHLRHLKISSERVKKLPESVCLLYHLQTLRLYCENIEELPSGIGNLKHLSYLDIWSICIKKLPKSICYLYHLKTLSLYCENLEDLPSSIGNLKHLRYLYIWSVYIKKLPESICYLYHLQTLSLYCENLEELPSGIGNLKHLRYLDIWSICIKKLPESVCLLYHLQTLIVQGFFPLVSPNDRDIPCILPVGIIRKLTNLQILHTKCTVHDSIGVLKQLVNLPTLYISGLRNVVNIEDAKDADLKHKHELRQLFLCWNAVAYGDLQKSFGTYEEKRRLLHLEVFPEKNKDNLQKSFGTSEERQRLLHLEVFPEKNKDIPTDEKREEAMLEYLQPHANLEKMVINGYGGSKFPKWMGNLHSLKTLKIYNCFQLQLLSEKRLPFKLQYLHIKECQQLTSLPAMHSLTSLKELTIKNCPKLQIMAEDQSSFMPSAFVKIVDCPGLGNWCQIQKINCFQVVSGNKLTISNTWEKIKQEFNDLTSTEHGSGNSSTSRVELLQPSSHLYISNDWESFPEKFVFEELTIWSCTCIPSLWWLSRSTSLHGLVVKDCPGVKRLPQELLPSTLKSLVVDSCENLRTIQLAQADRDALEELQILNCPNLITVEGLNRLFIPKFLKIQGCLRLSLS